MGMSHKVAHFMGGWTLERATKYAFAENRLIELLFIFFVNDRETVTWQKVKVESRRNTNSLATIIGMKQSFNDSNVFEIIK